MTRMKLGTFILAALCAATPAYADRAATIAGYQRAYGESANPHLLTQIADEYRAGGDAKAALAYYCSYMFTAPAGDDADYASAQAHALRPDAASDHDACTAPAAPKPQVIYVDAPPPPRISKREIAGIATVALAAASFGLGLYEANEASNLYLQAAAVDPMGPHASDADALNARAGSHEVAEKYLLAGGALALVTGGVLYLNGRHSRLDAAQYAVAPVVSKHSAGLALGGSF
jgi:hypothetical protein